MIYAPSPSRARPRSRRARAVSTSYVLAPADSESDIIVPGPRHPCHPRPSLMHLSPPMMITSSRGPGPAATRTRDSD
jgi:hypothetical protein